MKSLSKVIAISVLMSGAAYAGQPAALSQLVQVSGPETDPAVVSAPLPSPALPQDLDRAFAADALDLDPARTDLLVYAAREAGFAIMQLDGGRMTTKKALLSHLAKGLNLKGTPSNWDAMIDMMREMHMIHSNERMIVVVRNASRIQAAGPQLYADFRETAALSCADQREWSRGLVTMKFVFVP